MAGSMEGYTYDAIKRTLGKGVAIGSSLGYSFSENFALEVDLSYLTAGATEIKFNYLTRESYQPATSKFGVSSSMFRVGAGIVLRSGGKHLDPYLKFGMSIASATVDVVDESESPEKAIMKRSQYSGGMAMGFLMAPGVEYTTRKGTTFFGELNYTGISYCPARREYTEYRENGSDRVRELSERERVIVYIRSEPESYAERKNADSSKPKEDAKISFPSSRVGVNIGIRLHF